MTARGTMVERRRTWVIAIDGARARVFTYSDRNAALVPIDAWLSRDARRTASDAAARRLGEGEPHAGHARHAKDPKADPHFRRKLDFLKAVADTINQRGAEQAFDSLIVVAPAPALAVLRHDLSPEVQERITIELAQDLTRIPGHYLPAHLARELPTPLRAPRLRRG